jgi:ABC-2 type transport system ATP-binding protein
MSNTSVRSNNENNDRNDIIILSEVTKIYPGGSVGIQDLSLKIKKGEIFGFLGQNGAGKTTCIRCILNILIPDKGEIKVSDQIISRSNPEIKEIIGYLPGELHIPGYYKVSDFLKYMASLRKRPSNRMKEISEIFELPLDKKVSELSKGNKQKIGIVISFMHDPDILILDEPTSGLDPIFQQKLYDLILDEKSKGKTIFFSSHNLDEVQKICDRVGIIREGKLVSIERVSELSEKINRLLIIIFDELSDDIIKQCESLFSVSSINKLMGELKLEISSLEELASNIEKLKQFKGVRDIAYPPASLESFFMSKYLEG